MFWTKYIELCEKNNIKPRALASKLGAAPATVTRWKNGSVPNRDMLENIAKSLGVTVDFLLNDEEYSINMTEKRSTFKKLTALPQRWNSLHSGSEISKQRLVDIADYTNSSLFFLGNDKNVEFVPDGEYDTKNLQNIEVLFEILNIMDACADTDFYRTLQIQLSRIVLYHLERHEKKYDKKKLSECRQLNTGKMKFLYTGVENTDITLNYGLNFSDLSALYEFTNCSYVYMFTGIADNYDEVIRTLVNTK